MKPSVTRSASNCFTIRCCLRDYLASAFSQPASLPAGGSTLLGRSSVANFGSIVFAARILVRVFLDMLVSCAILRIDRFCPLCTRWMIFKSAMLITLLPALLFNLEGRSTWLSSGCKSTSVRHRALRPGLLETQDRISRPEPDHGEDMVLESLRQTQRREAPRQPDWRNRDPHRTD